MTKMRKGNEGGGGVFNEGKQNNKEGILVGPVSLPGIFGHLSTVWLNKAARSHWETSNFKSLMMFSKPSEGH